MKLSIPGQLKGPEAKVVMKALIGLRRSAEPAFQNVSIPDYDEVCVLYRVGGSLGSFGSDSVEEIYISEKAICCEVIMAPRKWGKLEEKEVNALVSTLFMEAYKSILKSKYGEGLPHVSIT